MSDELTPDERRVRALTRTEIELRLAARAAMIERDGAIVESLKSGTATPAGLARATGMHVSRFRQIRRQRPAQLEAWAIDKPKIEAEIKALDE
jgi:hypothetical protein